MPYYCTVPRCTSMAGKAKNVSFHQFPRDEELARLWNDILKRGKPYTKYSKVCSLHFKPEDYTITSVGKNKGQWRTLRKDAVPSQNLPSETPAPYSRKQWDSWSQGSAPVMDQTIQHQMAQAIYMQTMMAMQATGTEPPALQNGPKPELPNTSYHEDIKNKQSDCTYRCTDCAKCFKDPDVFILHKRTHTKDKSEKENYNVNLTLRSNPILANLLKTDNFDQNIVNMENLLLTAIAANMDYLRNYSTIKEDNFEGYDNPRDGYDNREDYRNSQRINESSERNDLDRNKNGFDTETVNRSYRNDCRSDTDAMYDLNRLKSDLNRRSVEIHVRSDLSQANVQVKSDLSVHEGDSVDSNQITESVIDKSYLERQNHSENHNGDTDRSENNGERINHSENINDQENVNSVDSRVNGYAVNFASQDDQIPYKASFYRESYAKNSTIVDGENLLAPNCSLQFENFPSKDENCSKSDLNHSSSCDTDVDESLDSNSLVIDESV